MSICLCQSSLGDFFYTESWGAPILSGVTLVCRFKPYYTRTTIVSRIQVLSRSGSQEQQHHFIDLLDLNVEGSDGMSSSVDGLVRGNEKNCVKLRGLPWAAKPEDVISFLWGPRVRNCSQGYSHGAESNGE